jgi:high-affinity nickel permease
MKMYPSKIMRSIKIAGAVSAFILLVTSIINGCLLVKLYRCLTSAQRAISKVNKAAEIYIESSTKENTNSGSEL